MELTRSQVLEKRTTKLAINILDLCKKYPKSFLTNDILPAVNRGVSFGHPEVFSVRLHPRNLLRGLQRAANETPRLKAVVSSETASPSILFELDHPQVRLVVFASSKINS